MLTNVYSGRILIVNQDFQVIKDTYDLDKGKYMISKEVVKCFQKMKESSHYDRKNSYIEMTMPIPGTDGETTQGVLLISISTEEIVSSIDILEQKGLTDPCDHRCAGAGVRLSSGGDSDETVCKGNKSDRRYHGRIPG